MHVKQAISFGVFVIIMFFMNGCAAFGVGLLYKRSDLPDAQIVRNIQYAEPSQSDLAKNRLDLFLPQGKDWPTMVFVHGGTWSEGDKDLKVAGADVYSNIGRYFASQGIATAVISYRLMPAVDWRSQVIDVARATSWVYRHIGAYHGNTKNIFLAGHSAGAQIATRVALDSSVLNTVGLSPRLICGVIPISGIGYNFLNEETYQLGKEEHIYEILFNQEELSKNLRKKMSSVFYAKRSSPPFMILYAAKDQKELKNASKELFDWLTRVGARSQLYMIPKETHESMVLALSRKKSATDLMTVFMKTMDCSE